MSVFHSGLYSARDVQGTLRVDSVPAQSRKKVTHRQGQSLTQGFLIKGHKMKRKFKLDGGILR